MTWLDEPLYPASSTTESYVYVGGKPIDVAAADFRDGLARMGEFWRRPSYLESYLTAASLLIEQGAQRKDYDTIGLPVLYLQRHATELLLKRLLGQCIEIVELKARLSPSSGHDVPSKSYNEIKKSHNLIKLLQSLKKVAKLAEENSPPNCLTELVELLAKVEKDDHWSRYGHGYIKDDIIFHHEVESTIPVVKIKNLLGDVVAATVSRAMGDDTYENDLYSTWSSLNCALEDVLERGT